VLAVTNEGSRAGSAVVQFYIERPDSAIVRAPRQLVGYEKVHLAPGDTATVPIVLDRRALAHWDTALQEWAIEPGAVVLAAGFSSRDLPLRVSAGEHR
jgi:beta-glucosidase